MRFANSRCINHSILWCYIKLQKESAVNTRITLLGIIAFLITRPVYADIGMILPNYDANCDHYVDNQSLIFDPAWKNSDRSVSVLTIFTTYLAKYSIGNFTDEPARHYFSRKLKWGSIRFQQRKMTWRVCLRRPAFVPLQPKTQNIGFRLASYFDLARMT